MLDLESVYHPLFLKNALLMQQQNFSIIETIETAGS